MVRGLLGKAHGVEESDFDEAFPIEVIKTSGDRIQNQALNAIGGKGLFTKELEEAMAENRIDIAVHSMKDMPTVLPEGLILPCMLEREDPRDAFISRKAKNLSDLAEGATVGSTSLRRQAQILANRPDLKVVTYRGNVQTRLKKLAEGEVDATILALAGMRRLGIEDEITSVIEEEEMLPAVAQGAIGIEMREDDEGVYEALKPLSHRPTILAVTAERALLAVLDGSCRTPIGGQARLDGDTLTLRGLVLMPDGTEPHRHQASATIDNGADAIALGVEVGSTLRQAAGEPFFEKLAAMM
jgi:hydroxymethylbilane synthase